MSLGLRRLVSFIDELRGSRHTAGHVAMLHTGRVGSTVVAKLLEQHPGIQWDGEVFERRLQRRGQRKPRRRDRLPPLLDIRARVGAAARAGRCYGFETKHQMDQHGFVHGLAVGALVDHLSRYGIDRFIEVRRENYLRQVVSTIRLRQTGKSHAKVGQQVEHPPIIIDPRSVPLGRRYVPLLERFLIFDDLHVETRQALAGRQALHLTYERDIEQDPLQAYRRICAFIELEPVAAEIKLRRTNDAPLVELIENYDEVADLLAGSRYEWMLSAQAPSRSGDRASWANSHCLRGSPPP